MIEFVEYTGCYPALCVGVLTVRIDGETVAFGGAENPSFWVSGGSASFDTDGNDIVTTNEWFLLEHRLKKQYRKYAQELIDLFNEHVPYGCCGGCI